MFEGLQSKLGDIFDGLKKRGALKEADVDAALREIRVALLEADVALSVVKSFIDGVRDKAVGQEVLRSVQPGQQVVKIVHDHLVEMLRNFSNEGLGLRNMVSDRDGSKALLAVEIDDLSQRDLSVTKR